MTREEAIEIVRDTYHTDEEMKALETLIPELRESEDERIRRTLVEYFGPKVQLDFVRGIPIQKIRDWLEKQKEQKKELVYRLNGLMQEYINEAKDQEEEEHRFKCYKLFWDALEDANYFEQKEQKPNIELIQRSWYMEGYHDREFGKEPKWILKTGEGGPKHEPNPKYGQPLAEQRPTEEQLHNLNEAIKGLRMDGCERIADSLHSLYNILKTQEQKPAEKQDYSGLTDLERAIHRGFLVAGVENVPVTIIKETAQDCLAQMKPSDFPAGFYVTLPDGKKYYTKEMRCNGMNEAVEGEGYETAEKDLAPLIEAATIVYEAWNGGTMDDVRREMVELGKRIKEAKQWASSKKIANGIGTENAVKDCPELRATSTDVWYTAPTTRVGSTPQTPPGK